ncbi:hypothetical protein I6J18_00160 (plasmid) [Peribacillus psychrosaccharolyticus]|uniref:Uncharacterized protein n=1 Tax=Peribacillus psychrosaccharolyticus TaxID=1407 RepID=A0A974NID8_PERPY|nr:hypothetical protein [Peribacillus psychrosaccharolyticus]MEC2054241.1 hypothetical protein [Peribacillus psychrosaccharolyticus]MED3746592.1 hypothetical protein [Peribacillus psychrosaccharolyticus]QQS98456.1 hypothetical protein I6J18_00160 [Peribacillus psychrosaccharolyticus]
MYKEYNGVEIIDRAGEADLPFEQKIFDLVCQHSRFDKSILLSFLQAEVRGDGRRWMFCLRNVEYAEYKANYLKYVAFFKEIHEDVFPYFEQRYGLTDPIYYGSHERQLIASYGPSPWKADLV